MLDALVRGEVLKAADMACQRLKSLEQISHGASPQLAIKLEILPQDRSTLASSEEAKTAASEHQRELKLAATWNGTGKTTFRSMETDDRNSKRVQRRKIREDAMIEDSMSDTPEVAHEIQTDELSPVSAGDHPSFPSVPIVSKLYTNANCQAIWEI